MKERLLVTEFWGLGDLAIASEFLRRASAEYELVLIAKPYGVDVGKVLWPSVTVIPFIAPWTQFTGKYRLHKWPWRELNKVISQMRDFDPQIALSARWDPRDHLMLRLSGAPRRIGFPRRGSHFFLTDALPLVPEDAPRSAQWEAISTHLRLPPSQPNPATHEAPRNSIVFHTGAAQALRVWPIERYAQVAKQLRESGWETHLVCDSNQSKDWQSYGETPTVPASPLELLEALKMGSLFIGNDSGPGHLAAALGIPTFTIFGPQRPEWFLPNHPAAGWIEGKPCPYKPCFDYCRFPSPTCIQELTFDEVAEAIQAWLPQGQTG